MFKKGITNLKEITVAILSFPFLLVYGFIIGPIFTIIGSIYSVSIDLLREIRKEENKNLRRKILVFFISILGLSIGLIFYLSPLWSFWFGKR